MKYTHGRRGGSGWLLGLWVIMLGWPGGPVQAQQIGRGYIDDSLEAAGLVQEIEGLIDRRDWGRAADGCQSILDRYGDKLLPMSEDHYSDASFWVRRAMSQHADLWAAYDQRYRDAAERSWREARRPLDLAGLESVYARYGWTSSGLGAGLDLVAARFERGEMIGARRVLIDLSAHPALAERLDWAERYHMLGAALARVAGDPDEAARHAGELEVMDADAALAWVAVYGLSQPPGTLSVSVEQVVSDGELWSVSLAGGETGLGWQATADRVLSRPEQTTPKYAPVAWGSLLLVNRGDGVTALDRYSGRVRWAYRWAHAEREERQRGRVVEAQSWPRTVAVESGGDGAAVYACLGTHWQNSGRSMTRPMTLVRLDAETGEPTWTLEPRDIDESLRSASFDSAPVVLGGRVFVLVTERAHQQATTWVQAIDGATGEPLWRRFLVTMGMGWNQLRNPVFGWVGVQDGALYATNGLGYVARFEPETGAVRWLRRVERTPAEGMANDPRHRRAFAEAEVTPVTPVLLAGGVLYPPTSVLDAAVLLSGETGDTVGTVTLATRFTTMPQLVSADGDLVVIGQQARCFDGRTLQPRWSRPIHGDTATLRAASAGRTLTLMDDLALVQVDLDDPASSPKEVVLDGHGHLFWAGDTLVRLDQDSLSVYAPFVSARSHLLDMAELRPEDPAVGLSLIALGRSRGNAEAVQEGASLALAALEMTDEGFEEGQAGYSSFVELISVVRDEPLLGLAEREALLEGLALMAETPALRVMHQIATGRVYVDAGRLSEAVALLQGIVSDEQLSVAPMPQPPAWRTAGQAARMELERLFEQSGEAVDPAVWAEREMAAEAELAQITSGVAAVEMPALQRVVDRHPGTRAEATARLRLAAWQMEQGQLDRAAAVLRLAYERAPDAAARADAAAALAAVLVQADRPRALSAFAERAAAEGVVVDWPVYQPAESREGWRVSDAIWQRGRWGENANVVDAGTGRLIARVEDWRAMSSSWMWSPEHGLLRHLGSGEGANRTHVDLRDLLARVLRSSDPTGAAAERAHYIAALRAREMSQARTPLQTRGDWLAATGAGGLTVVADRAGRVMALDGQTGLPIWGMAVPIDELGWLEVGERWVLAVGMTGRGTSAAAGAVAVMDRWTGQMREAPIQTTHGPLYWAGLAGAEHMVVVTQATLTVYRLADQAMVWQEELTRWAPSGGVMQGVAWAGPELVMVHQYSAAQGHGLYVYDTLTGESRGRVPLGGPAEQLSPAVVATPRHQVALTTGGAVALDRRGQETWRVELPGRTWLGQAALHRDGRVLLVGVDFDPSGQTTAHGRVIVIDDATGRIIGDTRWTILELPEAWGEAWDVAWTEAGLQIVMSDRTVTLTPEFE